MGVLPGNFQQIINVNQHVITLFMNSFADLRDIYCHSIPIQILENKSKSGYF